MLSHSMCGDLDGCGFRYILLQADLIQCIIWNSHSQFHAFVSSLYPFLAVSKLYKWQYISIVFFCRKKMWNNWD